MKNFVILFLSAFIFTTAMAQNPVNPPRTKIMTLGVYHFAYHNRDAVKVKKEDQISVLDEPYHSQIVAISNAIIQFKPTIIAIERAPNQQKEIDSLYALYKSGKFQLGKDEIYQLGFRIGKALNIPTINCINDWGKHYASTQQMLFKDSVRANKLNDYYMHFPDSIYQVKGKSHQVKNITRELIRLNNPEAIRNRLGIYLLNPFKYEEKPGDFAGVDFETGRWFSRNLRIFRNTQRLRNQGKERILLIIGREHLNLLNLFYDVSREFELVSPLPYMESAKNSL